MLPAQLQYAELGMCYTEQQLAAVMPLQQLTSLGFIVCFNEQEPLLRLTQLPALQELQLSACGWDVAVATAPAWGQLPQLRELQVAEISESSTGQQLAAVTPALKHMSATGVSTLQQQLSTI